MWPAKRSPMSNTNATITGTVLQVQKLGGINWQLVSPEAIADFPEVQGFCVFSSVEQVFMGLLAVIPGLLGR